MMNINAANPTLVNCHFEGNTVTYSGGGLNVTHNADTTMTNCVFASNDSWHGAAVYTYNSDVQMSNCTIYGNNAERAGGALFMFYPTVATRISNSVLWNNTGALEPVNAEIGYLGSLPAVSQSVVKGGFTGTAIITSNPQMENAAAGDFRLMSTSPAIDAGNDDYLPMDVMDLDSDGLYFELVPVDMNGDSRLAGSGLDMGAFEFPMPGGGGDSCPADLMPVGGDGIVSVADVNAVIAAFNEPCGDCTEDIVPPGGDGQVTIDDIVGVLQAFGDCP
jgi:hypothetical protein